MKLAIALLLSTSTTFAKRVSPSAYYVQVAEGEGIWMTGDPEPKKYEHVAGPSQGAPIGSAVAAFANEAGEPYAWTHGVAEPARHLQHQPVIFDKEPEVVADKPDVNKGSTAAGSTTAHTVATGPFRKEKSLVQFIPNEQQFENQSPQQFTELLKDSDLAESYEKEKEQTIIKNHSYENMHPIGYSLNEMPSEQVEQKSESTQFEKFVQKLSARALEKPSDESIMANFANEQEIATPQKVSSAGQTTGQIISNVEKSMGISKQQDDQEFEQDFTKEPIVHAQKSNSIIIEGKQISMGQFYEEADLSNIQTSSDVSMTNQVKLERIMNMEAPVPKPVAAVTPAPPVTAKVVAPAPAPVVTKAKEVDYQHLTKAEKRILDQKQYDLKRA